MTCFSGKGGVTIGGRIKKKGKYDEAKRLDRDRQTMARPASWQNTKKQQFLRFCGTNRRVCPVQSIVIQAYQLCLDRCYLWCHAISIRQILIHNFPHSITICLYADL